MVKKLFLFFIIPCLIAGCFYVLNFKIFSLLLLLIIFILIYIYLRNLKIINKLTDEMITVIKNNFEIKNINIGESAKLKMYGIIPIDSKVYHLENIGVLSIMKVNLGIMQMLTLSINPFEKDLPQVSYEVICIFQKIVFLIDFYGLMLDKDNKEYKYFLNQIEKINKQYSNIENFKSKKEWHTELLSASITKKIKIKQEKILNDIFIEVINIYIDYSKQLNKLDEKEKLNKISLLEEFGNNLVDKGGYSTDVFKKLFGIEKTRNFLGDVIFGYYSFKKYLKFNKNK